MGSVAKYFFLWEFSNYTSREILELFLHYKCLH